MLPIYAYLIIWKPYLTMRDILLMNSFLSYLDDLLSTLFLFEVVKKLFLEHKKCLNLVATTSTTTNKSPQNTTEEEHLTCTSCSVGGVSQHDPVDSLFDFGCCCLRTRFTGCGNVGIFDFNISSFQCWKSLIFNVGNRTYLFILTSVGVLCFKFAFNIIRYFRRLYMNVLVACEESQTVCFAFRSKGHNAFSCDIQDCSGGHPEWHIKGDVLKFLNPSFCEFDLSYGIHFTTMDCKPHFIPGKWDLIIAHPPCTYMSKAGARWMFPNGHVNQERLKHALVAKAFFLDIWNADCESVVIENPTPLKIIGLPSCTQIIQPYKFDKDGKHPYSKRTCLWIRGIPILKETSPNGKPIATWMPSNTGGFSRGQGGGRGIAHDAKTASKTFEGVAKAMAEQWGL